ncbi:hypothetical protein GALL_344330 [mine drainage metagenome]|uniref:Uncharacterized protein n=1 Tax=mine drainage metagenome TaxID=410659 RepID=A0A1J5R6G9_9ZZZZ
MHQKIPDLRRRRQTCHRPAHGNHLHVEQFRKLPHGRHLNPDVTRQLIRGQRQAFHGRLAARTAAKFLAGFAVQQDQHTRLGVRHHQALTQQIASRLFRLRQAELDAPGVRRCTIGHEATETQLAMMEITLSHSEYLHIRQQ